MWLLSKPSIKLLNHQSFNQFTYCFQFSCINNLLNLSINIKLLGLQNIKYGTKIIIQYYVYSFGKIFHLLSNAFFILINKFQWLIEIDFGRWIQAKRSELYYNTNIINNFIIIPINLNNVICGNYFCVLLNSSKKFIYFHKISWNYFLLT